MHGARPPAHGCKRKVDARKTPPDKSEWIRSHTIRRLLISQGTFSDLALLPNEYNMVRLLTRTHIIIAIILLSLGIGVQVAEENLC
jgi:hypothetical protein